MQLVNLKIALGLKDLAPNMCSPWLLSLYGTVHDYLLQDIDTISKQAHHDGMLVVVCRGCLLAVL